MQPYDVVASSRIEMLEKTRNVVGIYDEQTIGLPGNHFTTTNCREENENISAVATTPTSRDAAPSSGRCRH